MIEQKSLVKNVADPEQVKKAGDKVKFAREQQRNDWNEIISLPSGAGKRIIEYLCAECGIARSPWSQSAAIHRDSGHQEIGHLIMRRVVEANPQKAAEMLIEAYKRELQGEPL